MKQGRIAITGMGAICSLGNDVSAISDALISGKRGIRPLQKLDLGFPDLFLGEVQLTNKELAALLRDKVKDLPRSRTALLGLVAAFSAIGNSASEERTVVISASTVGGMDLSEQHFSKWNSGNLDMIADAVEHPVGSHTAYIAQAIGSKAMRTTISTACSSSANAMILGGQLLRTGRADRVLVGGSDALCKFTIEGFMALSAMDTTGVTKPFSNERNGMNLGEGAAYLVMQREEDVTDKIEILAYFLGGSNRNDAYHQTATSPDGHGPYLAMKDCIEKAGLKPNDIDHINAHGTGTENNDSTELAAMERLFGSVPDFTTTKALTGHTLAAAGALEAVIAIISMREGIIPVGYSTTAPIEGRSAMPVSKSIRRQVKNVLSNSLGFGGNDTSILLSSAE
ncbi:MAG: beta-ketoacyl-[acyl-carrier-protein] synthase family protein [Flavobacteriales bacterium]|nr:beta-ketoacyl-[acyl-carrier-protein] synthase family protein [Flavobacteriales bacterium]MBK7240636.1 beta-ketoacyl-[acyl-carrier-protein] synthase family protein [Flavobacteriales bacterium]MBK9535987.1 beta-ketoacyl-[acyl-carrier-protein] synthase family protein [Flavobacteriales bacterium]HQV52131.1 beta-ketoacyl-[acyl-carrier-protein] synthase family protein [Flavobacteriales bacterium]HQX29137.1 beta-ketoacyl-[acyl-carrier-protein] synthase family protein [Flavobacteriales bacterium]